MSYEKISGFSDEISESIDIQFEVLSRLGIRYFEARGIDGKNISLLTDEEVQNLKAKMDQYDIQVSSIGSPVGKIKLEESFEEHFAMFQNVVKIAKTLGSKYIRMFSFYHEGGTEWTKEERALVLERLQMLIAYAKEQDVILLHENEKDIYGDTVERVLDLMQELSCDHFKVVFDPANFVQCQQDTKYAYKVLKDYIAYMHIKDARLEDDKVVPAGEGDGNIPYIVEQLLNNGYDGFFSMEPHLGTFAGLADLELDDKMLDLPEGGEGTFTLAYNAFSSILEGIK